jgi:acyl-CoA hydrolase
VTARGSLAKLVNPGCRIAVGDGAGCPQPLLAELSEVAAAAGDVELVLGWSPTRLDGLDFGAFASVCTLMAGYHLRKPVDQGLVRYLPVRFGNTPALLAGPLRCDLLVASVSTARAGGWRFTTEVAWLRSAVAAGAAVAGFERTAAPALDAGEPLDDTRVTIVGSSGAPPSEVGWAAPGPVQQEIGRRIARLVPAGARLQFGPGGVGAAAIDALAVPVCIDTGVVTDSVVDLDRRGLLLGRPMAAYVAGDAEVYQWSDGRVDAEALERTTDPARLAGDPPLVAVNTALEVDLDGQVNVESVGGSAVAGVGGQPDYMAAGSRSMRGLSIVALPSRQGAHTTLVDRLSAPASTPSHDVDVLVTELGSADLRGLDRAERRRAIAALWD